MITIHYQQLNMNIKCAFTDCINIVFTDCISMIFCQHINLFGK